LVLIQAPIPGAGGSVVTSKSISNDAQYVTPDGKIYCGIVKMCSFLSEEVKVFAPNSCNLPWLVKGATQLCTSKTEYNKLDLIAA